ncbi:phenylalanine--tRNA ligase subunit beta [Candidatus Atribacteria bacterium RBG_19FT_COMBO_35_14]|uniref:Phenylalanine--tRNA ligase beta subunit n=1 Tax=Candidatus Sediminicultor quintus TaxID=1797291 RepID=A0A1F5AGB1_9BACT|nr:MAG: phenylalanine--tRNA ligase subunit beta [Candidatus Atribacteria bacterium RBG_19FT_COMBO_35_14]
MQVSYNLLKEYIDIDISAGELAKRLTINGIVLERMEKISTKIEKVIVGRITAIDQHPENKKLSVCQVDIKEEVLQIICGAKNMKVSDKVVVALEGAKLPQIGIIKSKKFKNVLSSGMLCSASELGIEPGESPGILILEEDAVLGEDIRKIIKFDDTIFDFEIHSNRPDLMSIIGIAREVAVITDNKLKTPEIKIKEEDERIEKDITVKIEAEDLCPRYTGRVIKNITVGESPLWLKWKLKLLGARPINNIVDITNFIMMETGQPLHAFDLDLIKGKTIIVRRSRTGETICTLDDVERQLPFKSLVIADIEEPIALAGIMGGKHSEIDQNTKNVFLESAYFSSVNNRRSTAKFGLRTEASNRFEKGIDKEVQIYALDRAADLINKIAMGKISSGKIDTNKKLYQPCKINLRIKRVNRILGQLLDKDESKTKNKIINILNKLEFKVVEGKGEYIEVIPPSFRGDVEREIDIIEEIARIYGYDKIKPTLFNHTIAQEGKNFRFKVIDQARETLIGCGLNEVITYSFISPDIFDRIRIPEGHKLRNAIKIKDPMTKDHSLMRTSLISSLLEVIKWNTNRQAELVKIFEVGKIYLPCPEKPNSLPQEKLIIAGAINKIGRGDIWEKSLSLDIFDIKGIIETVFQGLKVEIWEVVPGNHPAFHPLRNGKIIMGGEEVGIFGEIHPEVINNYRIPGKVNWFEIDFENLLPHVPSDIKYCVLPKYPSVERDLAVIIKEEILSVDIIKTIKSIDEKLIKKVTLFDIFKGKQIGDSFKSLAYSVVFQAEDRTLTDHEVGNTFKKIREKLMVKFDAKIRE